MNIHALPGSLDRLRARGSGRPAPEAYILPISARAADALADLAERHDERLTATERLSDVCYSAGSRRTHHRFRTAAIGTDASSLKQQLAAVRSSETPAKPAFERPRIVYVFPGLGAQWTGMARALTHFTPLLITRAVPILVTDLNSLAST